LPVCDRCGEYAHRLYPHGVTDDDGEKVTMWLCWDCDWEITNGRGDYDDDPGEILLDRWEEEYEYDPVNTPPPY